MRRLALAASFAASLSTVSAQDPSDDQNPKAALAAFRAEQGGNWVVQWHPATGTPSAIYGTGLALAGWTENSLAHARLHANQLLTTHRDLLGLGTSDFRESIGARMGRSWSFTFDQYFRGLPVIDGRADIRINMIGVVAMLGSRAWPIPANFGIAPRIGDDVATAVAWQKVGEPTGAPQPAPVGKPRLVIWGDSAATAITPVFLAWEVPISNVNAQGEGPIGRYYVDALNGAVLEFRTDKHECGMPGCSVSTHAANVAKVANLEAPPVPTTVTVTGWTRTGNDAFSALVNAPLPGLVLNVPGVGSVTTDLNGQFTIDIAAPVNIVVGALDGRHHAVLQDTSGNAPAANVTVNPGVPATIQLLTAAATTAQAAHTTTSYWIDLTNEFSRSILGNSTQLATASSISPRVNIASTCNAYYTGNTINFYQAGGGCANTSFSTVIAHEWGHGLDERYGGIFNSNAEGLSEGWGDIMGLYLVDSPLLGSGFQTANVALRRGDNAFLYPYSGSSPHAAGQVWMGYAWRLRERLRAAFGTPQAIAISNDIVIGTIVANATTRVDAVREVFIADDNDGNLANGTPNYAHLSGAAIDKAIPYPQLQVASIAHTALGNTTQQLTPRVINCVAAPVSTGSITQVRLHYNAGAGAQIRTMHPNGATNGYSGMLPGLLSGSVSYHIEAVHSSNVTVRLPESGEYSYVVTVPTSGPFVGFHLTNFDAGAAGFTSGLYSGLTNDWQIGVPNGKSSTVSGVFWSDPSAAASNGSVYGTDLGAGTSNGRYPNSVSYYLRSPAINCTGRFGCFLRFRRWLTVEEGIYDQATILVNGIQVWTNPLSGNLVDSAWQTVEYAIPMADNNAAVTVEFRLTADAGLNLGGWNIDDFELGTKTVQQLPAELRMLPEQAAQGAAMTAAIVTPGNSRPFLLAIADQPGPTNIPGIAFLNIGGNIGVVSGSTDASGNTSIPFNAPAVPSTIGIFYYSQVLTFDATFTQFAVSNPHINLFTQN